MFPMSKKEQIVLAIIGWMALFAAMVAGAVAVMYPLWMWFADLVTNVEVR